MKAALLLLVSFAALGLHLVAGSGSHRSKMVYYVKPGEEVRFWRAPGQHVPPTTGRAILVAAYFDMNGIKGSAAFYQEKEHEPVTITLSLSGLDQFDGNERWGWHVHEYPMNWAHLERNPCNTEHIGGHYDPENRASDPNYAQLCMNNASLCEVGDLGGRHGHLRGNQSVYTFTDNHLNLYSPYSIVGRSLIIHRTDGFRYACTNIEYNGISTIDTYRAAFPCNVKQQSPVFQGEVIMRRSALRHGVTLEANLYRVDGGLTNITHNWYLKSDGNFNVDCSVCENDNAELSVFGTKTHGSDVDPFAGCGSMTRAQHLKCPYGDLTRKCGPLRYTNGDKIQAFCTDTQLGIYPHESINVNTILVIEDENGNNLACAKFEPVIPIAANIDIRNRNVYVAGRLFQYDPHDPTYVQFYNTRLGTASHFQVRAHPVPSNGSCTGLGPVYEPRFGFMSLPSTVLIDQTGDRDFLGELQNKIIVPNQSIRNSYYQRTSYLPLFGDYSVIGRSFVVLDNNEFVIGCGNITDADPNRDENLRRSLEFYHRPRPWYQ